MLSNFNPLFFLLKLGSPLHLEQCPFTYNMYSAKKSSGVTASAFVIKVKVEPGRGFYTIHNSSEAC